MQARRATSEPDLAREFDYFRLVMQTANDFDPVLDAPAVRAYEIAKSLLFGSEETNSSTQTALG